MPYANNQWSGDTSRVQYVKVVDGEIVKRRWYKNPRTAENEAGEPIWRPLVRQDRPAYNPETHYPPIQTMTIEALQVVDGWADPVAKTAQEVSVEEEAEKDAVIQNFQNVTGPDKALAEAIYFIVSGKVTPNPSITREQFYTWLRNRI